MLYFNEFISFTAVRPPTLSRGGVVICDMNCGQTIWSIPDPLRNWNSIFNPFQRDQLLILHSFERLFVFCFQIGNLEGHYHFKHDETSSRIQKRDHIKTGLLNNEKNVVKAIQQQVLERFKRDGFPEDPKFPEMWYLVSKSNFLKKTDPIYISMW